MFLLLVLFGGAFAGVPLSFGETHCGMSGMANMDCCKSMFRQKKKAKPTAEALLCALDCAQKGTTLTVSGAGRITPPAQTLQASHPPMALPGMLLPAFSRTLIQAHSPPGSPPTYIRHLALLI